MIGWLLQASLTPGGSVEARRLVGEAQPLLKSDVPGALALARQAREVAERDGDTEAQVWSLLIEVEGHFEAGQLMESELTAEQLLELVSDQPETFDRPRSAAYLRLAYLRLQSGNLAEAQDLVGRCLYLARQQQVPELEAAGLNALSAVYRTRGLYADAIAVLRDAALLYHSCGDTHGECVASCNIGQLQSSIGRTDDAISSLRWAYSLIEDHPDERKLRLNIMFNLGSVYLDAEDYPGAESNFRQALQESAELGDRQLQAATLINLGLALQHQRADQEAFACYQAALELTKTHGFLPLRVNVLDSLGSWYEQASDPVQALDCYRSARDIARGIEYADGELDALLSVGRLTAAQGDLETAAGLLGEALDLAGVGGRAKGLRDAHQMLSDLYKRQGRLAEALEHFEAYHAQERELFSAERDRTTRTLMMQFDVERSQAEARLSRAQRAVAEQAQAEAEALVQARTADLEQAQMEVVARLAMAAEFRDDATGEHTRRVGIGAALIAEELGLSRSQVDTLRVAACLHDVGKIGIPDAILLKRGKLTAAEFEEMKRHTLIGARLLSGGQSEVLNMARQIALTHHERWDGGGYPNGLAGREIPLMGRIVALADVFDALVHFRPYKLAWDRQDALAELVRQRGRQFDPELTDVALRVLGSARYDAELLNREVLAREWLPER
ncbi:HD domain-containing phosphohydrolase [Deinococcus sonorensis]|uniref:HD domain-containing phosphohydrolase n=2 Tax=Deinococcus sonorensis TaxID=309891 RepID=A0AAU7UAB2_9DEIO